MVADVGWWGQPGLMPYGASRPEQAATWALIAGCRQPGYNTVILLNRQHPDQPESSASSRGSPHAGHGSSLIRWSGFTGRHGLRLVLFPLSVIVRQYS